jgi:ubiquinone/menaquinone biosynthesis C-methylase UbiE
MMKMLSVKKGKHPVCPIERAGGLDNRVRRWIQNPRKILKSYVKEGMIVLDVGCGPGFFSKEIAQMVGKSGRVIAVDLQEGMLQKLRDKIQGTELEERIILHKSEKHRIGVLEEVDFVLAFYVIHELPNQKEYFEELKSILKPKGQVLVVEPLFFVRKAEFDETIKTATDTGFLLSEGPAVFFSKTVILIKD